MDAFLALPEGRRRRFCEEAQVKLGLPAPSIEKDFWACWTLRELFRLPQWGTHFTIKGGTSLSKAWKLIERFSEDIDVVIDRDFLGFGGLQSPEAGRSKTQLGQRLDALKAACQRRINDELKPTLELQCHAALSAGERWSLVTAPIKEDPDQQSLLFHYPSVFSGSAGYVIPVVKIELGARSDTEPSESPNLQTYLDEAFPDILGSGLFAVRAVAPRRTFWEKAMLLHEETYRPAGKPRKARLARHYYDLWCLIKRGVADDAANDVGLFDRVAAHRAVFFRHSWMEYSTLQPGSLRLVPPSDQTADWRRDYQAMRTEMFFGIVPGFEEILEVVSEFEERFNRTARR